MKKPSIRIVLPLVVAAFLPVHAAAAELSVMTFNIRYGTANDGANAWPNRKALVIETIRRYGPDVLGVQECLNFQAQAIGEAMPEYGRFGMGREADGSGERMEIFYRSSLVAPLAAGHFWLSATPEIPGSKAWNSSNVRMVTWIKLFHRESRRSFYFINTHLDHRSEEARVNAAEMIREFVESLAPDLPVVITGDFNATAENSVPYTRLFGSVLKDAWLTAAERTGPTVTWSGFEAPDVSSQRRIDWIGHTASLTVSHCETVTYDEDGRYPSDHFPVFARMKLPW